MLNASRMLGTSFCSSPRALTVQVGRPRVETTWTEAVAKDAKAKTLVKRCILAECYGRNGAYKERAKDHFIHRAELRWPLLFPVAVWNSNPLIYSDLPYISTC